MTPVQIARSLLDVPWVHQGRDPRFGLDCIGLLIVAFDGHETTDYSREPHDGLLEAGLRRHFGEPLPAAEARVGDVALLRFGRMPRHVGIIADYIYGGLSLIHTDSMVGCVTEHPLDAKWQRRVVEVYRP